ncbi:MAG TPA: hypothetical protein VJO15_00950, partial [Dehalococcoidia bacterium]|nr:hypothetical protein [Dehalococcoidia bacterium]
YAFLLLPVGLAAVLLMGRNWSTIGKWMAAQAGAAAIFAFWLPGAVNQWGHDPHVYRVPVGLDQVIANVAATLTAGDQAFAGAAVAIALVLSAILIAGLLALAYRGGERPTGPAFTLIYLAAPVLFAYLLASGLGVNIKPTGGKYFIILLPPYALLLASGILSVGKLAGLSAVLRSPNRRLAQPVGAIHESPLRGRGAVDTSAPPTAIHSGATLSLAAIAFVVVSSSYLLYSQYFHTTKEDFRAAARYIEDHEWPGDAIILNAEHIFAPFAYYYRGKQDWHRAAVGDTGATGEWLAGATQGRERVWLLLSHETVSDREGQVESWLDSRGLLVDEKWFPGMKLAAYLMSPHPASLGEIQYPVESDFGRKVRLLGYSLQPTHPEAKSLRVILFWRSLDRVSEDLHVNLGLFDGQRRLWSQWDKEPLAPAYTTSRWVPGEILKDYYELPIPPGTPPGDYLLGVRLYSPSSGYGLEVSSVEGPLQRDELRLGTVSLPGRQYVDAGEAARSIATPATTDLGGGLMLVGGTLGSASLHPGTSLDLTLLWKVVGELDRRSRVFVELVGDGGAVWGRTTLDHQSYASPWQQGALVRERVALAVPKAIASGRYVVRLGVEGKPAIASLGGISVLGLDRSYTVPTVQVSQAATLGQAARFLGYDLPRATLAPGEAMDLTLYWQATAPMDEDYTVFVHLLDSRSAVIAQRDNMPAEATRPTSTWLPGEVIEDRYRLQLPPSASPGAYAIEVGMYLASTGNRLPVSGAVRPGQEDRVLLKSEVNLRPK